VRVAGFGESEAQRLLVDAGIGTVRGKVFAEAAERGDRTRSSVAAAVANAVCHATATVVESSPRLP